MKILFAVSCLLIVAAASARAQAVDPNAPLSHVVFFDLKDASQAAQAKLVAECKQYLSAHEGMISFAAGTRVVEATRDVNDQAFQVSLLVVFENKGAHDAYQKSPRHLEFIARNEDNWQRVRVFDSYLFEAS